MSLQQTAYSLPNFSVRPSRDQRAPYDTIHNLPAILNVTSYAGSTLPTTFVQAGSLLVKPVAPISIALPDNLSLFRYLGGFKYISNGDIQSFKVINRATDPDFPWVLFVDYDDESGSWSAPGTCDCLVIQWTTEDQQGNKLPLDEVFYRILPSSALPIDLAPQLQSKQTEFKAKLKSQLKRK